MVKVIINNSVYDLTTFIDEHPGGWSWNYTTFLSLTRNSNKPMSENKDTPIRGYIYVCEIN